MVSFGRYGELARTPGFWITAVPALIARLPVGMTGLTLVLVTTSHSGSYADGGAVSAACAIAGAASAPLRGRATDRVGPRLTLVVLSLAQAVLMLGFMAASIGATPLAVRLVLAAAVGAVVPPTGAMMRSLWQRLLTSADVRDAAFALESMVFDIVYIAGPLIVAAVMLLRSADLALLLMAAMVVAGSVLLARSPAARDWPPSRADEHDWLGPLRSGGVLLLLPISFFAIASIGAFELGAVAAAGQNGHPASAGLLIAAVSVGSIAGGFYWGSRRQPGSLGAQQGVLLAIFAAGLALTAVAPGLLGVGLALTVAGLALSPMITTQYSLMQRASPPAALTEAFSWLNSMGGAGAAIGAAAAGLLASHAGASAAFLLGAVMAGAAAALSLLLVIRRGPIER